MKKYLGLILLTLSTSACVTTDFKQGDSLKHNEGLALLYFDCHSQVSQISIHKSGNKRGDAVHCSRERKYSLIKLEQGDYYIGNVQAWAIHINSGQMSWDDFPVQEENAYKFKIQENAVNYIGDIKTITEQHNISSRGASVSFNLWVENNEENAKAHNTAKQYNFKNSIAYK